MPLYEYRCLKCGEVFEVLQKFSDPPLKRCSSCRGKLEKLVSRTSFQLKGGGWYAQGYSASRNGGGSGSGSGSAKSESSDKSDTGSTKKTAAGSSD